MLLFDRLQKSYREAHLGHGLLLSSSAHAPTRAEFEKNLWIWASALLCVSLKKDGSACGQCESCRNLETGVSGSLEGSRHPDFMILKPQNHQGYAVPQIRQLFESFSLARSLSPVRIAWIQDAEGLSASGGSAANALLKLLEEPRPDSILVLTTTRPEAVLATLRSRCQHFRFLTGIEEHPELPAGWERLGDWVVKGGAWPVALPPDEEGFWKERSDALFELLTVESWIWSRMKSLFASSGDGGIDDVLIARSRLAFLESFQQLQERVKTYGNPQLLWTQLKVEYSELPHGSH